MMFRAACFTVVLAITAPLSSKAVADDLADESAALKSGDCSKSLDFIRRLAEQGNVDDELLLGGCYAKGKGVDRDPVEALKWYRLAAEQGNPKAEIEVGKAYTYYGSGVARDVEQTLFWYRKAADQGDADALYLLGDAYNGHLDAAHNDPKEAAKWYKMAFDAGAKAAAFSLGLLYERSDNLDRPEAASWYERAVETEPEGGSAHAALSRLHDEGYGGPEYALPPGPSFDCGKAAARVERLICSDAALSSADRVMARSYARLIDSAGPRKEAVSIVQRLWLGSLSDACPDAAGSAPVGPIACLKHFFTERHKTLAGMAGWADRSLNETSVANWVVREAYPFVLQKPAEAEAVLRTVDTPQAKLGLVLALKFGSRDAARNEPEIRNILAAVDEVPLGPQKDGPTNESGGYDGTDESLIPYILSTAGLASLPCELIVQHEGLSDLFNKMFLNPDHINQTNFVCLSQNFNIPKSVDFFERDIEPYTSDYFRCYASGFARRIHYGPIAAAQLELKLLPNMELRLSKDIHHDPDESPLRLWSYLSAGNRINYLRLRREFMTAIADVAAHYERAFHLDPASAGIAARTAMWRTVAWGQWEDSVVHP